MIIRPVHAILVAASLAALSESGRAAEGWDIQSVDVSKLPPVSARKGLTFAKDILPIFKTSCIGCHGEERQKGDLRLDSLPAVLKGGEHGTIVVPGDSKKSLIAAACAQLNDKIAMPPKPRGGRPGGPGGPGGRPPGGQGPGGPGGPGGGRPPGGPGGGPPPKPLTPDQVGLLRAWIDQGAK